MAGSAQKLETALDSKKHTEATLKEQELEVESAPFGLSSGGMPSGCVPGESTVDCMTARFVTARSMMSVVFSSIERQQQLFWCQWKCRVEDSSISQLHLVVVSYFKVPNVVT